MNNLYAQRIESLRSIMRGKGWDAVIITGSDPHSSEYPARRWKQVEWLTGFTGEAGDVVVTLEHAGLWTDTRYFIQAVRQLEGTGAVLHKTRIPEQVLIPEWLREELGYDAVIAVDGLCQSADAVADLEGFQVVSVPDLLSAIWEDRPSIPQTPISLIESGESRQDKISWLRGCIAELGGSAMLVSALDEIAWLLNARGSDIDYNPLSISFLLVSEHSVKWFVLKDEAEDPDSEQSFRTLAGEGVEILPYDSIYEHLDPQEGLLVDTSTLNFHIWNSIRDFSTPVPSPVPLRKSIKNPFEIDGMRRAHVVDGVAMEQFLFWLEKSLEAGKTITEWDAATRLSQYRLQAEGFRGESFETISAYGAGAALPHYITPCLNAPEIQPCGLYLCDSGGQYEYGTTDITRTIPLGDCSYLEKEDYTLVLKGHIDLAMAVFPKGTAGCQIDALARGPLWSAKRNFGHGTGHGVGFFLGVHEGPQDIRQNFNRQPLMEGMITSDEPGIYREGMHGIRHENLLLCRNAGSSEFGEWLCFETLTLCHFDTSAILKEILDKREIDWLNAYNQRVFETLSPLLPENVAEWLRAKTRAI